MGSCTYTKAVDMWSIGCIMAELYTGKSLFPGKSTINQIEKIIEVMGKPSSVDINSWQSSMAKEFLGQIQNIKKPSFNYLFGSIDNDALKLLRNLLVYNPNNRFTA